MKKILSMEKGDLCGNNCMIVDASEAGRRLDNYLLSRIKAPRPLMHRLIRKGAIRVNGKRVKHDHRLLDQDVIRLPSIAPKPSSDAPVSESLMTEIKHRIVLEDSDLLIIDKPAGLASQPGSGMGVSAIDVLKEMAHASPDIGLAHRIDRQTSGCLVFGKHKRALITLQVAFRERMVKKTYVAILENPEGLPIHAIDQAITVMGHGAKQPKLAVIDPDGKAALTGFKALCHSNGLSLVLATPETGRMHQIRVHAQAMGAPIVGDQRYNKKSKINANRLFLHAYMVSFEHPSDGGLVSARAPIPTAFADRMGLSIEVLVDQIEKGGIDHCL